jgi:pimeloyl-ACP methyl ester carboxylesterase
MRTQRIPVADGVELAVDAFEASPADGVPFVLVHGLASNARLWDGVAAALVAGGHPAYTVDLRGHGRSSKPVVPYDVPTVAADLATLIGRLGLERPVVAGQSWGGNVVLELAAAHPGVAGSIVCVDGGWLDLQAEFPDWAACRTALAPPRLAGRPLREVEAYLRSAHADWPESGIRGQLANFEVRGDGTIAPWLTFERHLEVLRGLWEHRPAVRYPSVRVPALLLPVDGGDPAWSARKHRAVDAAAATLPNARVHWFHGDHDIHAQHPDEVAGVMHDHAASIDDPLSRERTA